MYKPPFIVVDCETTGLHPYRDRLHGFATTYQQEDGSLKSYYTFSHELGPDVHDAMLYDADIPKVNHNIRFDLKFLKRAGIEVNGRLFCSQQMYRMLDENGPAGLKELTAKYLGVENLAGKSEMDALCAEMKVKHVGELAAITLDPNHPRLDAVPLEQRNEIRERINATIAKYAVEDTVNTYKLYRLLKDRLLKLPKVLDYYLNEIMPAELALMEIELRGVAVDATYWNALQEELKDEKEKTLQTLSATWAKEISELEEKWWAEERAEKKTEKGKANVKRPAFNWGSTKQVAELIYDTLRYPEHYTDKGNRKVDESVIRELSIPGLSENYLRYKALEKELGTYLEGFREHVIDSVIFSNFPQRTVTGRTSSQEPNMQNIPRGSKFKNVFVPRPGHAFVYADYSQVELRIAAHNSQDPVMLAWFKDNLDPHQMTGDAVGADRQVGKALNFALIYDAGPYRLAEMFKEAGVAYGPDECRAFRQRFFETHRVYRAHLDAIWDAVVDQGFIAARNGRVRRLPEAQQEHYINRKSRTYEGPLTNFAKGRWNDEVYNRVTKEIAHAKKQAFNFPVQSVGASITKAAIVKLQAAGFNVVLSVHDSIIMEVPLDQLHRADEAKAIMEGAYPLSVPLKVDLKILKSLDEKNLL